MMAVLLPALRGGGNDFQAKDVQKLIQDSGIVSTTQVVASLLTSVLTTGGEVDDEKKPQEEK